MSDGLKYSVKEAAQLVGVSAATLRLWEREGLILPQRSEAGHRLYDDDDVIRLRRIQYLRSVQKLNLAAIRHELTDIRPERTRSRPRSASATNQQQSELGRKLRVFRLQQDLTLEQVSEQTGLSISFLSAAERGTTGISLASLLKLTLAYKIHLPDLYEQTSGDSHKLIKAGERQIFEHSNTGVRIEQLTHGPALMEAQYFVLEPGASSEGAYSHEGEELIFVLKGSVDFYLDESEHYHVEAGDCLYFTGTQFHRWENTGHGQTHLMWVNSPPTFQA